MGAGNKKDHYHQDAAEAYFPFKLQKLAVEKNKSISDDYSHQENNFNNYCKEREITDSFFKSEYCKIANKWVDHFFSLIEKKHPNCKFDFIDVEKEYRNKGKKGDFLIKFSDGTEPLSVSLKNYKKGFSQPQLCSGTWVSLLFNLLLPSSGGPGMFIHPEDNKKTYRPSTDLKTAQMHLESLNLWTPAVEDFIKWHKNDVLGNVCGHFKNDEKTKIFDEYTAQRWKKECKDQGNKAVTKMLNILNEQDPKRIKSLIIKMSGMNYDEELLLISDKEMMFSHTDTVYQEMLKRINSEESRIEFHRNEKSIIFSFVDECGIILDVKVPFTLQKNGAWWIPKDKFEGKRFHEKEKQELFYGERRPNKCREMNTSVNTFLQLKKSYDRLKVA
jgi:hypothetical protein